MKCPKCGKEFSEPILPLHTERCGKEEAVEKKVEENIEDKKTTKTKTSKK